jgi:hypothetical protein
MDARTTRRFPAEAINSWASRHLSMQITCFFNESARRAGLVSLNGAVRMADLRNQAIWRDPFIGIVQFKSTLFLSGKFLVGEANINLPRVLGNASYVPYAPGFVADYKITPRLATRAEYEYQIW